MVLGDKEHVLYGQRDILWTNIADAVPYHYIVQVIYQLNSIEQKFFMKGIVIRSYRRAGTGSGCVLRIVIGTIGIIASKAAGRLLGGTESGCGQEDAVNNAKMNGIDNIRFYCNDAVPFFW